MSAACITVLILALSSVIHVTCQQDLEWWKTSVIYQVYPRSFKDSDGDGVGDIKGITSKLDHFVDLGIEGVWLSPIYKSPMKDFGYDISDFRDIDPTFGTLEDFQQLITKCKDKGLKLVMDMVPNHSSDEHEWFLKSVAREDPYTDYYTWKNKKRENKETGEPVPPNNWLSVFGGSAWTWNEKRQQFYLHQFHSGQPDLNFRNPAVLKEIKDIMNFWLDKGVDGFRMDAVAFLMEDQSFKDEPKSDDPEVEAGPWGYLKHKYTKDLPELYDIIYQLRENLDMKQKELNTPLVMMIEAYADLPSTMRYYGNATHRGGHFPFNFELISRVNNETRAKEFHDVIASWMDNMPAGGWPNWVIGNHDKARVASRLGRDLGSAIQIMSMLLPGTVVTYNGEEITMENTWISKHDTKDPQGIQSGDQYEKFSRDPSRTPFQWNSEKMAGFTDGNSTWLPINPNYKILNLEKQKLSARSPYKIYKKLTEARKLSAIQSGTLNMKVVNQDVFAFTRELPGHTSFLVAANLGMKKEKVDLSVVNGGKVPSVLTVYLSSLNSPLKDGSVIDAKNVILPPRSALVLQYPLP